MNEVQNKKGKKKPIRGYTRVKNIIFFLLWLYIFGKLFIADVETFIFRTYNIRESWILNYRFLILIIISILLWFKLGFWRFLKNLGLFILYPFKVLFWNIPIVFGYKIPAKLFQSKQYILLFGYVESVIGFFRKFRWSVLLFTTLMLAIITAFNSSTVLLLYIATSYFGLYLIFHFFKRIKYAINPLGLTLSNAKFLESREDDAFIPKLTITEKEKTDEQAIKKRKDEHIQSVVSSKYLMTFIAQQVDKYSKLTFLLLTTVKLIGTFTLSIFICALMSYCLYKVDPNSYSSSIEGGITFLDFIVYGFFNVAPDGIYLEPTTKSRWILKTIFGYVGVVCIGILLISIFTAITSTFEPVITKAVELLTDKSEKISTFLNTEYEMTEEEAIQYLSDQDESKVELIVQLKRLIE